MRILGCLLFILVCSQAQAKDVAMKWHAIKGAKAYFLQVSKDEGFEKPLLQQKVIGNALTHDLKSGIYYLRIQALNNLDKGGKWSKPFKLVVTAPVTPLDPKAEAEKISYTEKAPEVKTKWETPEKAPKYMVHILKDGKEIESKQTSEPATDFQAQEPGEYKVQVSAGYDKYYGPAVTVKKFSVAKNDAAPVTKTMGEKFPSRKPVQINLKKSPETKYYDVVLYKKDPRAPALEATPYMTLRVTDPKIDLGKLPPGRYTASISPSNGEKLVGPVSEYNFDVQRSKPVEFEKIDLSFRYNIKNLNYSDTVIEAGQTSNTQSIGGEFAFEGNMWFPDSNFGLRARGSWGNILIENSLVSSNELQLAGMYRYPFMLGKYRNDLKFSAGMRAWNIPVILGTGTSVNSSGSTNTSSFQILTPTFFGPVAGLDYQIPVAPKLAFTLGASVSLPMMKSSISSDGLEEPLLTTPNYKAEMGVKYALKNNMRLLASAGYQLDKFAYNATQGNNGTVPTPGSQTTVTMGGPQVGLGMEMTDEGSEFTYSRSSKREKFSDLDLTARYSLTPLNYKAHLQENTLNKGSNGNNNGGGTNDGLSDPAFSSSTSGNLELETAGFFTESHHGFRLTAGWGGYKYSNTTISYPEFMGQWGYRDQTQKSEKTWQFRNYLGVRTWQVPIVTIQNNNFFSHGPQLYGPADTAMIYYRLASTWNLRFMAEVSAPVIVSNKDGVVDQISTTYVSYKAETALTKEFSEDITGGFAAGYKADSLSYMSSGSSDSSKVQVTSPTFTIFGTYSF